MDNVATPPLPNSSTDNLPMPANIMAALGYFTGFSTIASLMMKEYRGNRTVRFHAFQAILFIGFWMVTYTFLTFLLFSVAMVMLTVMASTLGIAVIPLLYLLPIGIMKVYQLTMAATWIYLIVASGMGKPAKLPLLGKLAASLASP